jgi:hypothetical protein
MMRRFTSRRSLPSANACRGRSGPSDFRSGGRSARRQNATGWMSIPLGQSRNTPAQPDRSSAGRFHARWRPAFPVRKGVRITTATVPASSPSPKYCFGRPMRRPRNRVVQRWRCSPAPAGRCRWSPGVVAGHHVHQQRGVFGGLRHRAGLIQDWRQTRSCPSATRGHRWA